MVAFQRMATPVSLSTTAHASPRSSTSKHKPRACPAASWSPPSPPAHLHLLQRGAIGGDAARGGGLRGVHPPDAHADGVAKAVGNQGALGGCRWGGAGREPVEQMGALLVKADALATAGLRVAAAACLHQRRAARQAWYMPQLTVGCLADLVLAPRQLLGGLQAGRCNIPQLSESMNGRVCDCLRNQWQVRWQQMQCGQATVPRNHTISASTSEAQVSVQLLQYCKPGSPWQPAQ